MPSAIKNSLYNITLVPVIADIKLSCCQQLLEGFLLQGICSSGLIQSMETMQYCSDLHKSLIWNEKYYTVQLHSPEQFGGWPLSVHHICITVLTCLGVKYHPYFIDKSIEEIFGINCYRLSLLDTQLLIILLDLTHCLEIMKHSINCKKPANLIFCSRGRKNLC